MTLLTDLPAISHPLPWQEQDWAQLNKQMAEGHLPHALLLVGRQYIGKTQLALALSRLLLCAKPKGFRNCGTCHACELSAHGNHGDLRWVEPIEKSRIIRIEQIREVVRFTSSTASFGVRKVVVIAPADKMNANAFNALLKTLEEPANETYLILVCNQIDSIPPTIRSRCQLLRLETPEPQVTLDWLNAANSAPERNQLLLSLAGGLPLLAKQLLDGDEVETYQIKALALQGLITGHSSVPEVASLWSNDEISAFLEFLATSLQNQLASLRHSQLKMSGARSLFELLDEIYQLLRVVSSGSNPNKQLLLFTLLSKYRRQLGASPLGDNIFVQGGDG